MRCVMRYEIVVTTNLGHLSDEVTTLCQKGYAPLGGPILEPDPLAERGRTRYIQAVVLYGEEF